MGASVRAVSVSADGRVIVGTSNGALTELTIGSMDDIEGSVTKQVHHQCVFVVWYIATRQTSID